MLGREANDTTSSREGRWTGRNNHRVCPFPNDFGQGPFDVAFVLVERPVGIIHKGKRRLNDFRGRGVAAVGHVFGDQSLKFGI